MLLLLHLCCLLLLQVLQCICRCIGRLLQAVDPTARVGKVTGMLLEQDVSQIVPLFFFPEMVRSTSPSSSPAVACTRPTAQSRVVLQLLEKVKEAQVVLDLTHSVGGGDFKSPDPDPGAESADVSKARAHACVYSMLGQSPLR